MVYIGARSSLPPRQARFVCARGTMCVCAVTVFVRENDILRARGASVREHQALCTYAQGVGSMGAREVLERTTAVCLST